MTWMLIFDTFSSVGGSCLFFPSEENSRESDTFLIQIINDNKDTWWIRSIQVKVYHLPCLRKNMRRLSCLVLISLFTLSACEKVALMTTPAKKAQISHTELAKKAKKHFWQTLHNGNYNDITQVEYLLTAAYLQSPTDPELAAYLGFTHIWKITERQRMTNQSPLITNEIILAKKYFGDALQLENNNAIFQGFFGDTQLIEGQIFHDQQEQVRGYFTLKKAIHNWPEFNYFTAGYPMSSLSADSDHFQEGMEWQWKTLDVCAGKKINRKNPDFSPYMSRKTTQGKQRACWNSWAAPYNFQGFFLNMGDMLVKKGDWQTAIAIYKNAKLEQNYKSWPYRSLLEQRIINAQRNVSNFKKTSSDPDKTILFNSGYGCVACHQKASS